MIWFLLKVIVTLILLFFAWIPFKEAGAYRFKGQGKLLFEVAIYVVCALLLWALPNWFLFISLVIGGIYFYSKHKK